MHERKHKNIFKKKKKKKKSETLDMTSFLKLIK